MEEKIIINNLDQLIEFAEDVALEAFPNMVISLIGDLGTGKTAFAKGFGLALGIKEDITSPTFNLVKEYEGKLNLYHMDVYRLEETDDKEFLEEYFDRDGVTLIEWADLIEDNLPEERLELTIKAICDNRRLIRAKAFGEKYEDLLSAII